MQFATGLITTDFRDYPAPPYRGKNWSISYRIDRHHHHHAVFGNKIIRGREVIITASDKAVAQKAIGMIHAGLVLLWPDPLMANQFLTVQKVREQGSFATVGEKPIFQLNAQDIPRACLVASTASFSRQWCYALHKFLLSTQIYSPDVRSLDPSEGVHHRLSAFEEDHVRFAYSVVTAYSVIEELGLEVRATSETPARLPDGEWNPIVRNDLQSRLQRARIDFREKTLWHLRSTPTRIERKRKPKSKSKPRWARGAVRDCEVEMIDAIADASWLRSRISSHRFSQYVTSLSVYDVANVQHLARRLLLETLGQWRRVRRS